MADVLLDVEDIARLYRSTPGTIRTALYRHRRCGAAFRFPQPIPTNRRLLWLKSVIDAHLKSLQLDSAAVGGPDGSYSGRRPM